MITYGTAPARAVKNLRGDTATIMLEVNRWRGDTLPPDQDIVVVLHLRPGQLPVAQEQIDRFLSALGPPPSDPDFTD